MVFHGFPSFFVCLPEGLPGTRRCAQPLGPSSAVAERLALPAEFPELRCSPLNGNLTWGYRCVEVGPMGPGTTVAY